MFIKNYNFDLPYAMTLVAMDNDTTREFWDSSTE